MVLAGIVTERPGPLSDLPHKLLGEVRALLRPHDVGQLCRPNGLPADSTVVWREETLDEFLARFASNGDPNNRYMTYGVALFRDDLLKLDQVVWMVRRFARPLTSVLGTSEDASEVDMAEQLARNPDLWQLNTGLVEAALRNGPARAGNVTPEVQGILLRENVAFAPEQRHTFDRWWRFAASHPLARPLQILKLSDDAAWVSRANSTIQWVLDHVHLSKKDREAIEEERAQLLSAPRGEPSPRGRGTRRAGSERRASRRTSG